MDNIRKHLGLKNLSVLKKRELADELIKLIPEQSGKTFWFFDNERYRLAKRISKNGGFTYKSEQYANVDIEGTYTERAFTAKKRTFSAAAPTTTKESGGIVIDFRTRTKVGRNDPCP